MTATDKDTIYIDIDDEITGIIDKLQTSPGKVVAFVLPKRASVFQSIVNMKLLKRAADGADKHLVLITSEAGLLPLAGMAGVHVARTLTSKPEIPSGPGLPADDDDVITEDNSADPLTAAPAPEPAAPASTVNPAAASAGVETLMLDDEDLPPEAAADAARPAAKTFGPAATATVGKDGKASKAAKKKNKGLHVPNFERFRLLLILGGLLLILLIVGLVFAINVLPKATINIDTNAQNVNTNLELALTTAAKTIDPDTGVIPAKLQQQQKTYTQQAVTTGQKNNGTKANGSIAVVNCSGADATLVAGTGFSSGGNTYISQEAVTVPDSHYKKNSDVCDHTGTASVDVSAQSPGTAYNLPAGSNFTIAGSPGQLTAQGGTIAGGTDEIVQIVNQNDINGAKAKINIDDPAVKQDLQDQLKQAGYYAVVATYSAGTPSLTTSATVGDPANNVTVTEVVTYVMFGVKQNDLKTLVDDSVKSQIDTSKQSILSEGIDKATFSVDTASANAAQLTMTTVATAGPDLDQATIQRDAAGQKSGKIKSDLENRPGVTSVDVKLSPFWVSSVPKKTAKIKVIIAEPKAPTSHSNGNTP